MYMHLWIYTPSKSHDKIPLTRLHKRNQIDRIGLSADLISEPHRWWYNYDGALTSPHCTGPAINSTTCQNNCLMVTWSLYVHVIRSSPALLLLLLFECLRYPIPSRMHWYELFAHAYAILPRFRAAEAILPRAAPAYSYTFSKDEKTHCCQDIDRVQNQWGICRPDDPKWKVPLGPCWKITSSRERSHLRLSINSTWRQWSLTSSDINRLDRRSLYFPEERDLEYERS